MITRGQERSPPSTRCGSSRSRPSAPTRRPSPTPASAPTPVSLARARSRRRRTSRRITIPPLLRDFASTEQERRRHRLDPRDRICWTRRRSTFSRAGSASPNLAMPGLPRRLEFPPRSTTNFHSELSGGLRARSRRTTWGTFPGTRRRLPLPRQAGRDPADELHPSAVQVSHRALGVESMGVTHRCHRRIRPVPPGAPPCA